MDSQKLNYLCDKLRALLDPNQQDRNSIEDEVNMIGNQNLPDFLGCLSEIINKADLGQDIRMLAATQMKNFISKKQRDQWCSINVQIRNSIKANLKNSLISGIFNLQKVTSYLYAIIAKEEFPLNQGFDILDAIQGGASQPNRDFQKTALILLEFALNEFRDSPGDLINYTDRLFDIIFKINYPLNEQDIYLQFLKCVNSFIPFMGQKFNDPNIRSNFLTLTAAALNNNNEDICKETMVILYETINNYYHQMETYVGSIFENIFNFMKSNNDDLVMSAIFFFVEVAQEEAKRIAYKRDFKRYIPNFIQKLLEEIQNILLFKYYENFGDPDEFTSYQAVSFLLDALTKVDPETTNNTVFLMVRDNIFSNDLRKKSAAIYAYTAILDTPAKNMIEGSIGDCLSNMTKLLNDPNEKIRFDAAMCIEKLSQAHLYAIVKNENVIRNLFFALTQQFNVDITPESKHIKHLLMAIHYLCSGVKEIDDPLYTFQSMSRFLFNGLEFMLNALHDLCFKDSTYDTDNAIADRGFLAIGSIIESCQQEDGPSISKFMSTFYEDMMKMGTLYQNNLQKHQAYQGFLCNIVVSIGNYHQLILNQAQGTAMYSIIEQSFKERNDIYDEGILALSSIISIMEPQYGNQLIDNYMQYLLLGLDSIKRESLCNYSILALGDIIDQDYTSLNKYLNDIMDKLFIILNNSENIKLKTMVLNVFADLFSNYNDNYAPYIERTYPAVMGAISLARCSRQSTELDEMELDELVNAIVDYLAACIAFVKQYNNTKFIALIDSSLDFVMRFMTDLLFDEEKLSESRAFSLGGAFGDLISVIGIKFKQYQNDDGLTNLMKVLRKDPERGKNLADYIGHQIVNLNFLNK